MGTWNAHKDAVGAAVKFAVLQAGYRHIDCASIYGNEPEIGVAFSQLLSSSSIRRDQLFVTSKLWNTSHRPAAVGRACKTTLHDLQLAYLDLYLVHWSVAFVERAGDEPLDASGWGRTAPVPLQATWQAMENLVTTGLVKAIGVSNFTAPMLLDLLSYAVIKPVVNQIELHPYHAQTQLVDFCHHSDIAVTAYSPLGSPGGLKPGEPVLLADQTVARIAKAHKKSPAQILLAWALDRGTSVIPKSTNPDRITENISLAGIRLTASDRTQLAALDRHYRFVNPVDWWKIPYFD